MHYDVILFSMDLHMHICKVQNRHMVGFYENNGESNAQWSNIKGLFMPEIHYKCHKQLPKNWKWPGRRWERGWNKWGRVGQDGIARREHKGIQQEEQTDVITEQAEADSAGGESMGAGTRAHLWMARVGLDGLGTTLCITMALWHIIATNDFHTDSWLSWYMQYITLFYASHTHQPLLNRSALIEPGIYMNEFPLIISSYLNVSMTIYM